MRKQHADLSLNVNKSTAALQITHDDEIKNLKLSHDHLIDKLNSELTRKDEEILRLQTESKQHKTDSLKKG